MLDSQVHDVNVVAYTRSVRGWKIIPENQHLVAATHGNLSHKRDKIVGTALGALANLSGLMGTSRVEVTKNSDTPPRIGLAEVGQNVLDLFLNPAVRVASSGRDSGRGDLLGSAVDRGG